MGQFGVGAARLVVVLRVLPLFGKEGLGEIYGVGGAAQAAKTKSCAFCGSAIFTPDQVDIAGYRSKPKKIPPALPLPKGGIGGHAVVSECADEKAAISNPLDSAMSQYSQRQKEK